VELIDQGIKAKLVRLEEGGKYITYLHQQKRRNYENPEERVQADTFLRLVLTYRYPPERIRQFVPVQMGAETKEADIIVYNDDPHKSPHIVVECKKPEVTELEFRRAVDQAFSYAVAEGAKYVWGTSRLKNEYYKVLARKPKDRITVPDIPQFGVEHLARFKYAVGGGTTSRRTFAREIAGAWKSFDDQLATDTDLVDSAAAIRSMMLNDVILTRADQFTVFSPDEQKNKVAYSGSQHQAFLDAYTDGHVAATKPEDPGAIKVFDYDGGKLKTGRSIAPNGGFNFQVRHMDFHPSRPWIFVTLERQNKLDVFEKQKDGTLGANPLFDKTTLVEPGNIRPGQTASTIHMHPNGRFVYVGNRASRWWSREPQSRPGAARRRRIRP
jgi:Type I restriction enzyme R protein N terminus (HSDR_N)/Lactonase, 7-bladed beta-propeller